MVPTAPWPHRIPAGPFYGARYRVERSLHSRPVLWPRRFGSILARY